jgi:hypothetical protein
MDENGERTGKFLGVPYDWRTPSAQRVRSRWWNADEPRVFIPKSYGWGYGINLYRLIHPKRRGPAPH